MTRAAWRGTAIGWAMLLTTGCGRAATTPTPLPAPAASPSERALFRQLADSLVSAPQFRSAQWGVLVVDPVSGDTLFSHDAGKLFMPASNQKLLTGSTALAQLGPDYRWRTSFVATGRVRNGVLEGQLAVVGMGDPTISDAMRGDAMQPLREVADSMAARGIRRISGGLVSGRNTFPDTTLGFGWAWDDLDYDYSAGIDELFFNEGFSRIVVKAGARAGDPVMVRSAPASTVPRVRVVATTGAATDTGRLRNTLEWSSLPPRWADSTRNLGVLRGSLAVGDSAVITVAHRDPEGAYLDALAEALRERGIAVDRQPELLYVKARAASESAAAPASLPIPQDTLLTMVSPPLRDVLPKLEKPSQNQIAEILFKTLALEKTGVGTADSGRAVVERQLVAWGAQPDGFAVRDGSGLSRHDYVTPETIVHVLDAARRLPDFRVFYEALPIAGVDGTIRNRMKGTPAQGNVHAKTGTLDKARSLSGYVTTADGRLLLFSFLCNNYMNVREVDRVADTLAARLAGMRLGATTAAR